MLMTLVVLLLVLWMFAFRLGGEWVSSLMHLLILAAAVIFVMKLTRESEKRRWKG